MEKKEPQGSIFSPLWNTIHFINYKIIHLNGSKLFAGIVMILLNIGSKFVTIQFSKSTEEYLKYTVSKQLLVFCMAFVASRDLYVALALTAVFTILSEYLFNEESALCIVPYDYRVLHKLIDTNNNNIVSETEISAAIAVLEKAKREKQRKTQQDLLTKYNM